MKYFLLIPLFLFSGCQPDQDATLKVEGTWFVSDSPVDPIEKSFEISVVDGFVFIRDTQVDGDGDKYRILEILPNSICIIRDIESSANLTEITIFEEDEIGLVFTGVDEFLPKSWEMGDVLTLRLKRHSEKSH